MLDRPRSSRIYYRGKFFDYPLKATEALKKLGIVESTRCVLSYLKARAFPTANPRNFQEWVTNQFGARLFGIFFKTYTEKVWGMDCKEISADWAAQRIKGLSLTSAIMNALWKPKPKSNGEVIKSLINTFRYPRLGPGMLWEACAEKTQEQGGLIEMGRKVVGLHYNEFNKTWIVNHTDVHGDDFQNLQADHVISSAPMRHLIHGLSPIVSQNVMQAANQLRYRDFITVALIVKDQDQFSDNWIYIHDPGVKVGRVQNFKSWSPELVPDDTHNCYGLEYFCFEGDGLWNATDVELIELAKKEIETIGLAKAEDVTDGCVVRQPKAYPVYDDEYAKNVQIIRTELSQSYPNLHLIGRNGMHKYNNQDHAMMTAMLCVKNILAGKPIYDLWDVNQDAEYHEAGNAGATGMRMVPSRVPVSAS